MKLNDKQARFVAEYLIDLSAANAARRAGYSDRTARAIACELMAKPHVQDAIAAAMAERSERTEITADRVMAELAKIGFANMADYMRTGADGDPHLDWSKLTRDQAAALQEVMVEDFRDGRGEDARDVRRVKFKLADKRAALVDLGKHLGLFPTRHTGADGGPIQVEVEVSGRDLARRIALALAAGAKAEG